jgi:hypothetical protein
MSKIFHFIAKLPLLSIFDAKYWHDFFGGSVVCAGVGSLVYQEASNWEKVLLPIIAGSLAPLLNDLRKILVIYLKKKINQK